MLKLLKFLPTLPARLLQPVGASYLLIGLWTGVGAIATALDFPLVQVWDQQAQTRFFEVRGPIAAPQELVVLAMDERTDSQVRFFESATARPDFVQWLETSPWKRQAHAVVLQRLMAGGAKVVGIDVLFLDASSHGEQDDRELQQVLQRYRERIVLAAEYAEDTSQGFGISLSEPSPTLQIQPPLQIGYVNALPAADGRIHDLPGQYRQQVLASLGLTEIPAFSEAIAQIANPKLKPPKGEGIYFYGPSGRTFETISFWDVLDPQEWQRLQQRQVFKNKIVLVGATAESYQDFAAAPFAESFLYPSRMPGVEIHANAVATLLKDRAIAEGMPNFWVRGLFVLVFVGAIGLMTRLLRVSWQRLAFSMGIALGWVGIGYASFTYGQTVLPVVVPAGAIALNGITYFVSGTITEQLEKRRLRRTLERYVAPAIVQEILKQPDDYHSLLRGRKLKAAVLFSDIRSFTTISESMAAEHETEHLVEQLNTYLDAMVQAISEAGGTVDKFIGDAVMAEFGSPISQGEKEDAMNAVRAALKMRQALIELRDRWHQENRVLFFNGIGINYGELIAGNIGSERRLEYTVIGDTVNVASRVEGATKIWGTDILITKNVYDLVCDQVEASYLGEHAVKGHGATIPLYALICLKGESPTAYLKMRNELRRFLNWKPPLKS
ncbi:MAG TPA: adenylate/guanylate cyclase domain-containing protein [Leptolyngbyaceae cyanobacterium M33_DOE_097]|nr:adenylate/guanylate cyclase domain-containing protein [Leptolyngbyaceae cyanobacterium M33_DOE_097]